MRRASSGCILFLCGATAAAGACAMAPRQEAANANASGPVVLRGAAAATPPRPDGFTFTPAPRYSSAVPTLKGLLGHAPGARFTEHRDLVTAVRALAGASDRIEVVDYGTTAEGRPLLLCFVSSPENLKRKEAIAKGLRDLADARIVKDEADAKARIASQIPIVWLSYNVHGNEPSSSEAALALLYHLAAGEGEEVERTLTETLVVVDPCLNPDGRDRYVHWFESVVGGDPDPEPAAREHDEPPPGGRVNHYYFDMNRDWCFATQDETRGRLAWLAQFPPQVHVDFHEMSPNSSYFFFPADLPRNTNLPRSTMEWGERFGRGNADAFDRFGWTYYTAEQFDLLYPGYGDSFPSLRGAIGMTYEQAGHAAGGLSFKRDDGAILTLEDRVAHHFESSLSTIETARAGKDELLLHWWRFFSEALREGSEGPMREVALLPTPDRSTLRRLVELLLLHGIEVDVADAAFVGKGVHGFDGRESSERVLPEGTVVVPMAQPMKRLAKALLEPRAVVERTTFYDISAWSLPFAFGVDACWLEQPAEAARTRVDATALEADGKATLLRHEGRFTEPADAAKSVGWILPWGDANAPAALLDLLGGQVDARLIPRAFATDERFFPAGSILIPRKRGDANAERDLEELLAATAEERGIELAPIASFKSASGIDLGSEQVVPLKPPRVVVVATQGQGYGELRFLLERELELPFTSVAPDSLAQLKAGEHNVVLIPDDARGLEQAKGTLEQFLKSGGTVIAFGPSAAFFTKERSGLTDVTAKLDDEAQKEAEKKAEEKKKVWRKAAQHEREATLDQMPGALFEVELDPDHPLSFGLPSRIPLLATSVNAFKLHGGGTKVGRFVQGGRVSGFSGEEGSRDLGGQFWLVEAQVGSGRVLLFSESPTFRLGFRGPIRVLLNALAFYSR
jgi:zinc carboxypeptidase